VTAFGEGKQKKRTNKKFIMITLRFDPLQIFKESKTPVGLHARANWLGQADSGSWQNDRSQTVASLIDSLAPDGPWRQSFMETIRLLHSLWLAAPDKAVSAGQPLDWLMQNVLTHHLPEALDEELPPDAFRLLPFVKTNDPLTLVCATLFLASVYGRVGEEVVLDHYQLIARWLDDHEDEEREDFAADKSNILRALCVHPVYAGEAASIKLVAWLAQSQKESGLWPKPIPFFVTLNTLSRLNSETAHRLWLRAIPLLETTQRKDGTWGLHDHEWNTFLVVEALKNKKCL
jgi:hypothetical protein